MRFVYPVAQALCCLCNSSEAGGAFAKDALQLGSAMIWKRVSLRCTTATERPDLMLQCRSLNLDRAVRKLLAH